MLSSGTLNLKFMQRKPNPNIKPKLEEERNRHPAQKGIQREKGAARTGQASSSSSTVPTLQRLPDSSIAPTLTIVLEESLISFPWLSCRRSAAIPSGPTESDSLPAHIGRKSYGEFNQAIQKLDEGPVLASHTRAQPESASHKRSQPESSTSQSSRKEFKKLKIQSRHDEPLLNVQKGEDKTTFGDKMARRYDHDDDSKQELKKKKKKKQQQHQHQQKEEEEVEESTRAFKKPFNTTTIKSKRKTIVDVTEPHDNSASTSTTKLTTIHTASSSSSSKQVKTHAGQAKTRQEQQQQDQKRDCIVIPDDEAGTSSDENEMVNREIDLMFKEARKAQIT
ncbi:hypothetical protein PCANC_27115 [Puccinia coronata f. sp. avenae]|uniref:Uncharacterized protein n=1 Tax=Puccinia coronata f. sp. avenae TaxID=200324 RepID=A0A2N5RWD5_9BASI|nr:hypothetical protein PCANC_28131 [Puccinia coronata f. sp. avenae]PLW16377.1 hypothetical protein PCASD_24227 [Puccinia coronata f. sp. avenae]PLW26561.1 hypothetical protein PCANC_27115 [Puccinia coronata f. sp. avenae]PLW42754.1 hypothetical protein PCASD_06873 [Puccinia coronata f. sp. avenae]